MVLVRKYNVDYSAFIHDGGAGIIALSSVFGAVVAMVFNASKLGRWVHARIFRSVEERQSAFEARTTEFMEQHKSCKPLTEKRLEAVEQHNANDLAELKKHEQDIKFLLGAVDDVLEHDIHDNHMEQLKKRKDALHKHVIDR